MGTRLVPPHPLIMALRARLSNGEALTTVEMPARQFKAKKFNIRKTPKSVVEADKRCPMATLTAMLKNGWASMSTGMGTLTNGRAISRNGRGRSPNGSLPSSPPAPQPGREAWLPAEPASGAAARSLVSDAAADAGLDAGLTWDLMLATSEAFANAVQHGEPWPNQCILLRAEPCAKGVRVEVIDCGTFDSQLEPAALDATSGRGVQIIAAIVDRLEVLNGNGRTLVRFEKHNAEA
jgi:serine/threonine-protein kinase RsbW